LESTGGETPPLQGFGQTQVALNPDLIGDLPLRLIDFCRGNSRGCPSYRLIIWLVNS
jgi:hypothetical protein